MATATEPFQQFKSKLGIGDPTKPTLLSNRNNQNDSFYDKLNARKEGAAAIYQNYRQQGTTRVANDLVKRSAGVKFDEWGKPELNLADFSAPSKTILKGVTERGSLATQAAESRQAFRNATEMQNLGQYGFTGSFSVSGTDVPGATGDNIGARVVSMALQVQKNGTPYVWGGNSLSRGIDCSGLVQQIYAKMGIQVPRTTYEQAKHGKAIPVNQARPGDLVFYRPGSRGPEHVGIYIGNGRIVHAANSRSGVITSNLTNSNGAPMLVIRPY